MGTNYTSELSPLDLIEKSVKFFAIIIGFTYVCGLIITNLYLGRFGISNISLLRIQYILVGFDFIMFLFLPGLLIVSLFFRERKQELVGKEVGFKISFITKNIGFLVPAITLIIFIQSLLIYGLIPSPRIYLKMMLKIYTIFPWTMGLFLFYASLFIIFKLRNVDKTEFQKIGFFSNVAIFTFSVAFLLNGYSIAIHPLVHPAFAGGKPIRGDILLSEEGISVVNSLEMELDDNKHLRDVKIIYETSSLLYVIPQKESEDENCCVALPRKHVDAIRYLSDNSEKKSKDIKVNEQEQLKKISKKK